ncbi:MAG TPA: cytochrome C [Rhodanobacteraceae bacterium]|nr:cytochrome C [Rhodanobacteraceae bacterium]
MSKTLAPQRRSMPAIAGVVLLLLGLGIGAAAATMVVRTINLRHAYPRAVMTLMNTHASALKRDLYRHQCDAARSRQHLQRMAALADNIEPAFGTSGNKPFMKDAHQLQQALVQAGDAPLDRCRDLAAALQPVRHACDTCHQQFR